MCAKTVGAERELTPPGRSRAVPCGKSRDGMAASIAVMDAAEQNQPGGVSGGHYEHHRPEQTTLYRLVHQHGATFIAVAEAATGAELPQFFKDEFYTSLKCGILTHGLPWLEARLGLAVLSGQARWCDNSAPRARRAAPF